MITIKQFPPEIEITTTGSDSGSCLLLEPSQRQLLAWFAREKPEMVREALKGPIAEDNWDPAVHGYCGDGERARQKIKAVLEELERRERKAVCGLTLTDYQTVIALMKGEVGK
jgi:hypothetical protein